jgi:cytochrome P450
MHFTNAVIHESLRHASFTFLGVPRFATAPLKIGDHEVPAGTTIFANLHHVMNDPEYWHEPRMYNPDRFINPETGEFVPDERFIPFSIGKRACLGKLLAEQVKTKMSISVNCSFCNFFRSLLCRSSFFSP